MDTYRVETYEGADKWQLVSEHKKYADALNAAYKASTGNKLNVFIYTPYGEMAMFLDGQCMWHRPVEKAHQAF